MYPFSLQNNWELHASFFDAIVEVVTHVGQRSLDILEALLQQVRYNNMTLSLVTHPSSFPLGSQ